MSERAKEIAEKIIADVWPYTWLSAGTRRDLEAAVEKHMLQPHQVRDANGCVWERASNGRYSQSRCSRGLMLATLEKHYGPLTEVQGDPLPDPSELAAARARIAKLEKQLADLQQTSNAIVITNEQELSSANARIAELESEINKLKIVEVGSSEPAEIWDRDGDKWVRKSDGMLNLLPQGEMCDGNKPPDHEVLPILADALMDAGCDNEAILKHLRCGAHVAGECWVVGMLLNGR